METAQIYYDSTDQTDDYYVVYYERRSDLPIRLRFVLSGEMNQGALYNVTQTIDTYVYRALLQRNDIAMSSAASFIQSIVGFIFIVTANQIIKKYDEKSSLF